ncbi:DNA methyltransferase [Hypericibacter terrae]|uniref:DNA methyltransferase n=1 Tax=Hypericibacter terrae TaxID=2602015 RepID=A0A5J6MMC7_9PROT|nr:MT-A70 family methyltransferase [Hypericibacter terrae]QEX18519.1 DNA methyltransferase [Hypericibacter terrae]
MTVDPFAGHARHRYRVILADPPWRFETRSHRGQGKGASQHYDTMATPEIMALPVTDLAADDCTLLMWGCWPHLPDALRVIEAWGFTYKTCGFVWVKQNRSAATLWADLDKLFMGLGYGTRGNSEFCLRASRGAPKVKPGSRDVEQLILAPLREHSRKPDEQYQRIERLYDGPYLEMFARARREGWDAWGNQVGKFGEQAA